MNATGTGGTPTADPVTDESLGSAHPSNCRPSLQQENSFLSEYVVEEALT